MPALCSIRDSCSDPNMCVHSEIVLVAKAVKDTRTSTIGLWHTHIFGQGHLSYLELRPSRPFDAGFGCCAGPPPPTCLCSAGLCSAALAAGGARAAAGAHPAQLGRERPLETWRCMRPGVVSKFGDFPFLE